MMKRFFSFLMAIGLIGFWTPAIQAEDDFAFFEILAPMERQSYEVGETIEIRWEAHNFIPDTQHGITLRIAERNSWKRARIAYITQATDDGLYTFDWTVPDDFFSRYGFTDNDNFKIELRAEQNGSLVRRISSRSLLNLQTDTTPTNVLKTTVSVDGDEEDGGSEGQNVIPQGLQSVAHYEFKAGPEPWVVRRLSVVNDTEGDGFEADPNESTDVIEQVYVRYPDMFGELHYKNALLVSGKATFSDLDFYVPKRSSANLEVLVDVADPRQFNEQYSGQTFRVGLMTIGNNASTFEAVGQISSAVDNTMAIQVSTEDIQEFVVRSGSPAFALMGNAQRTLMNGDNEVYEFSISSASDIGIGRLVFDVTQDGLTTVDQVQVFRNNSLLSSSDAASIGKVYVMWDAGASSCFAHTAQNGAGTGMNCSGGVAANSKLILAFSQEEKVWAGQTNTYRLRFNVSGVGTGDKLSVRLATGDDNAKLNIGGAVATTGKIHNSGLGNELFGLATDFAAEASNFPDRNVVWTDRSADSHWYPTFTPGNPPALSATSSADYTNGYLLKLNALPAVISTQ
ncbi:hypothetical protein JW752_00995 [Candidatus Peregrinibacteria bacterium]|nr:hypothetical protein [Candidatus Peregrinibacteria bacterium]